MAGKGAEAVGFEPAPVDRSPPQPDGQGAEPLGAKPHGTSNLQQDLYSRYHFDDKRGLDIDPKLLDTAANTWGSIIPPMDVRSWGQSETTAVTGPPRNTYTGSTARSETNGFFAHEDQAPPTVVPSYVRGDRDEFLLPFKKWGRDILLGCEQQEGCLVVSERVPGAPYVETLEGEADSELLKLTEE